MPRKTKAQEKIDRFAYEMVKQEKNLIKTYPLEVEIVEPLYSIHQGELLGKILRGRYYDKPISDLLKTVFNQQGQKIIRLIELDNKIVLSETMVKILS